MRFIFNRHDVNGPITGVGVEDDDGRRYVLPVPSKVMSQEQAEALVVNKEDQGLWMGGFLTYAKRVRRG